MVDYKQRILNEFKDILTPDIEYYIDTYFGLVSEIIRYNKGFT